VCQQSHSVNAYRGTERSTENDDLFTLGRDWSVQQVIFIDVIKQCRAGRTYQQPDQVAASPTDRHRQKVPYSRFPA